MACRDNDLTVEQLFVPFHIGLCRKLRHQGHKQSAAKPVAEPCLQNGDDDHGHVSQQGNHRRGDSSHREQVLNIYFYLFHSSLITSLRFAQGFADAVLIGTDGGSLALSLVHD